MLDRESVIMAFSASGLMTSARWYLAMKEGKRFHLWFFLADLAISMGMGYFTFLAASELGYSQGLCSMGAGLAGAIGSRSVDLIQLWVSKKVGVRKEDDSKGN